MSEELDWYYRLQEEAARKVRISVLKDSVRGSVGKWRAVVSRAETLCVMAAVSRNPAWTSLRDTVDRESGRADGEDDENRLSGIQREIERCTTDASGIVQREYEAELERQRKAKLLRKALSALESLKSVVEGTKANELATRWEPVQVDSLSGELKRVQGMIDAGSHGEVPGVCDEIAGRVAALVESAGKKEQNYREVTEVKGKIAVALRQFGFVVKVDENRSGADFRGYSVHAKDPWSSRSVETQIGSDGAVRDDFVSFEGASCKAHAMHYIAALRRLQVEPERLKEHYRFDPTLDEKDHIQRPDDADRTMQSY